MSAPDDDGGAPRAPTGPRGHAASLEYHRILLDDHQRVDAYDRALRALVQPGDVVLDLGTGTGILAMLAARRGARVHAVESMPIAGLARQLVAANGLDELVTVHEADICTLDVVEPVDLVVGDFMGRLVVDDDMLDAVEAAGRWLAPEGRFCPRHLELVLAPIGDFHHWAVDFFAHPLLGLDLRPALVYAMHSFYVSQLRARAIMAPPTRFAAFAPPAVPTTLDATRSFRFERPGRVRGVAAWFVATLADDVVLTTEPGAETHWGQIVFPVPPCPVQAGDELDVRLSLDHDDEGRVWHWSGQIGRSGGDDVPFELTSRPCYGERDVGLDDG